MNENPSPTIEPASPTTPPPDLGRGSGAPAVDGGSSPQTERATAHGAVYVNLAERDARRIADTHPESSVAARVCFEELLFEANTRQSMTFELADGTLAAKARISRRTVLRIKPLLAELRLASYRSAKVKGSNPPTIWKLTPSVIPSPYSAKNAARGCDNPSDLSQPPRCDKSQPPSVAHAEYSPSGAIQAPRGGLYKKGLHAARRGPVTAPAARACRIEVKPVPGQPGRVIIGRGGA